MEETFCDQSMPRFREGAVSLGPLLKRDSETYRILPLDFRQRNVSRRRWIYAGLSYSSRDCSQEDGVQLTLRASKHISGRRQFFL